MKTRVAIGLLCILLTSLIVACTMNTGGGAAAIDKEQIKKEIQAKEDEFAAVFNSGEMKKIGYYAEDAISFSQNSPPAIGREAILENLLAYRDSASNGEKLSFQTNEVFVSNDGNQVVEVGYFKVVDADQRIVNAGYYMTLFEKRDGKYVSVRDMSVSDRSIE